MDAGIEKEQITMPGKRRLAKGGPGVDPHWTSGAKTIVGTAESQQSRIWFTIDNGALSEIYFPDVDQANVRLVRFLVTGPDGFFSDEIWDAEHQVEWLEPGVPGCRISTRCKRGRYTIQKEIVTDPVRDVLLIRLRFTPSGDEPLRLFVSVDPHLGDRGGDNRAWAGQYKTVSALFASRGEAAVAVAADPPLENLSVGYIGTSDAYTMLSQRKPLSDANYARPGNVSLAAEVKYPGTGVGHEDGSIILALAFGKDGAEAGHQARAGLLEDYSKTRELFAAGWRKEQSRYTPIADLSGSPVDMYRVSTAVLETHQSKRFPGGFVASLSLPWGFARTDKDVGGYHVTWPRDLVETAMAKLACGDSLAARSALFYLACTQNTEGGWSQNMWLDGTPHWGAVQMDGISLPILLADKLRREDALEGFDPRPLIHEAACFLLKHGPVTQQDRWEAISGYSPYTMAVQVAALLASAECAEQRGAPEQAEFLRQTADAWNDAIDELTFVEATELATQHGVPGYYMRMAPPERIEHASIGSLKVTMPNRPFGRKRLRAAELVSPDALMLVRFGVRAPDDPRMVHTMTVIDATLCRQTRTGPAWRRATLDGYGETADGGPFCKSGIGRGWPLLAGERAHVEVAAGRRDTALELLKTMSRQTSECGMLPEQVWDAEDIPERQLFNGRPSGSGMPLVWAHSEYIKLLRSLHEGAIWDRIPQTEQRYVHSTHRASFQIWRPDQRRRFVSAGKDLRIDLDQRSRVVWKISGKEHEAASSDSGLGLHTVLLPMASEEPGASVRVRIDPLASGDRDGADAFVVTVRQNGKVYG